MDIAEARIKARITSYTFEGGVEHRRDAFPFAKLQMSLHELRNSFHALGAAATDAAWSIKTLYPKER